MTAQFAGSRSLDDRRRRRLAQEFQEDGGVEAPPVSRRESTKPSSTPERLVADEVRDVVADESLIPSAGWKVCAFGISGLLFWVTIIWLGLSNWEGSRFEANRPTPEIAFQFLSVVGLLFASQLSFVIWWYRSRSRKDFNGRYRIWAWAGCLWGCSCLAVGLNLHVWLGNLASQRWPIHVWRPEVLYWLVPYAVLVLAVQKLLWLDMRQSRSSSWLWGLSLGVGVLAAGGQLGLEIPLNARFQAVLGEGLAALWQLMMAWTFLNHARFVVHVTNEAAPKGESFWQRLRSPIVQRFSGLSVRLAKPLLFLLSPLTTIGGRWRDQLRERQARRQEVRQQRKAERLELRNQKQLARQAARDQRQAERDQQQSARDQQRAEKKAQQQQSKAARQALKSQTRSESATKQSDAGAVSSGGTASRREAQHESHPREDQGASRRKRVLGKQSRIDPPHAPLEPHSATVENAANLAAEDEISDADSRRKLTKKEKRRIKLQRS